MSNNNDNKVIDPLTTDQKIDNVNKQLEALNCERQRLQSQIADVAKQIDGSTRTLNNLNIEKTDENHAVLQKLYNDTTNAKDKVTILGNFADIVMSKLGRRHLRIPARKKTGTKWITVYVDGNVVVRISKTGDVFSSHGKHPQYNIVTVPPSKWTFR